MMAQSQKPANHDVRDETLTGNAEHDLAFTGAPSQQLDNPVADDAIPGADAGDMAADTQDLTQALQAAQAEADALKDQLLRAIADAENIRRRAQRDREESARYAAGPFVRDIFPVADSLRRALEAVPADAVENDPALKALVDGIAMTEKLLLSAFERHHIARIDPMGQAFNSHEHQAMFEVPTNNHPAGTVVQVMQSGYKLHDRLLRPAMVGVAKVNNGAADQ